MTTFSKTVDLEVIVQKEVSFTEQELIDKWIEINGEESLYNYDLEEIESELGEMVYEVLEAKLQEEGIIQNKDEIDDIMSGEFWNRYEHLELIGKYLKRYNNDELRMNIVNLTDLLGTVERGIETGVLDESFNTYKNRIKKAIAGTLKPSPKKKVHPEPKKDIKKNGVELDG